MIERDGTAVYANFQDIGDVTAEITKYEQYVRDSRKAQRCNTAVIFLYGFIVAVLLCVAVMEVDRRASVWAVVLNLALAAMNGWVGFRFIQQGSVIGSCRARDAEMLRILRSIAELLTEENNDQNQEITDGN